MKEVPFVYVNVAGHIYVRLEDIITYMKEIASTEETDVRNRLNEAADKMKGKFK